MSERADLREVESNQRAIDTAELPPTLGALIRERAVSLGDKIACDYFEDGLRLSYRDIDEQADRLACALSPMGVRKGTHVAVMLPNVPEFFVTWVAIGRLGAVMVPINTRYTSSELAFVLNDSDAQFMVIDESYLGAFQAMSDRPPMLVDANIIVRGAPPDGMNDWSALLAQGNHPFDAPTPVTGADLLNIQYTSGTTGMPKGCLLTHDYWIRTGFSLAITRGDGIENVLVWAPAFYMDGMWQILSSFFLDATAYVARRMSMSRFFDWLHEYRINTCTFPEPALKAFPASDADKDLALKFVYAFGWRPESKREAEERFGCHARDAYGMTELGTATTTPIHAGEKNFERTCGMPTPDRRLKVVGEDGQELPRGEVGELWVSGPGIMWGYYKRPQANADVFRGKWFRTGDLFRENEDGYFFIVGRTKDMVKRSGENIAAREVEAVLNGIEEVIESAVVPVPDEIRGEEVKVYLRLRESLRPEDCPPQVVMEHCAGHLAAFKRPRYVAYIDDFPRTLTGKIAKHRIIEQSADLRVDAFDVLDDVWRRQR